MNLVQNIESYDGWLSFVAGKIYKAQLNTHIKVNNELLSLYWEIGSSILYVQKDLGWGSKIIDKLSKDISTEYPNSKGYSVRNLKYMRAFAEAYPDFPIVQVPLAQSQTKNEFVQVSLAQINWYHHISLLSKVKDTAERAFYIAKTPKNQLA